MTASGGDRARMIARLVRWLGPWASEQARPKVHRRAILIEGAARFDGWVYTPWDRRPSGATLVVPGLHYLGPADVRLDRFNAILASSGQLVLCPFLPEFRRARVGTSLVPDTLAAWDALAALPEAPHRRPGIFSISFGSYPAIHVAAQRDPGALTIFGGYQSFDEAIRFSLEGDPGRPHDPLNRPVVFINLLEHLPDLPPEPERLAEAWLVFIRRTWGKLEMKEGGYVELAHRMSARLPETHRPLFEMGAGVREGGVEAIERALVTGRETLLHLDPTPALPDVRCPITIVHGRDDDVIPYTQAERMHAAAPASHLHLTGLYAHTGASLPSPRELADELRAMMGIVGAMADGSLRGSLPSGREMPTDR
ncbi:MAG: alpha/beta hydrolase [Myxococcales bacterium]|nr:alpha/beta hydrolase [Myxococcales bacterium]